MAKQDKIIAALIVIACAVLSAASTRERPEKPGRTAKDEVSGQSAVTAPHPAADEYAEAMAMIERGELDRAVALLEAAVIYKTGELAAKISAERLDGPPFHEDALLLRLRARRMLERMLAESPGSAHAPAAALALVETRLCMTDARYPECDMHAIKSYEAWLEAYPYSELGGEVMVRRGRAYCELGDKLSSEGPWRSAERAELAFGMCRAIARRVLAEEDTGPHAQWARETIREMDESGRAYSMPSVRPAE